jgi:hypothetical protein
VVAFRLPRQGEAPSLWSRTIDRPGERFLSKAIAFVLAIVLTVGVVWRWRRRVKLHRTTASGNTRQSHERGQREIATFRTSRRLWRNPFSGIAPRLLLIHIKKQSARHVNRRQGWACADFMEM